jgi:hypothetical protein
MLYSILSAVLVTGNEERFLLQNGASYSLALSRALTVVALVLIARILQCFTHVAGGG